MKTEALLLTLSISLIAGLLLSRLAKKVQLPAVTAYLVAGVLIGPYCLGLFGIEGLGFASMEWVEHFSILCDVALGFIAFSIGNEFRLSQLKQIGKQATIIGILQAVITTVIVDIVLITFHFIKPDVLPLPVAITLGAIAAATAPAATLMVVKQYKAKGPVTSVLLPVVALDDAVGLVLFAISFGVARSLGSTEAVSVLNIALEPIIEVILSLVLGAVMGFLFNLMERYFHSRSKRMAVSVAFILITVAISSLKFSVLGIHVGFSPLLSCMMLGTVFCNICDFSEELMERVDRWCAPLLILFFVISGAELNLGVFSNWIIVLVGVVYIISRSAGKMFGAFASAKLSKSESNIVKYLGITLLPQAGVALGMAKQAKEALAGGDLVINITLFAVLVYELVGPFLTKKALEAAGEIKPEGKTSARHEHIKTMSPEKQEKHLSSKK